jgi:hypothetical protein
LGQSDKAIKTLRGKVPYKETIAGKIRDFSTNVHEITEKPRVCFMGEFCSPVETLRQLNDMLDDGGHPRLDDSGRVRERQAFHQTLYNLIQRAGLGDEVKIILHRDADDSPDLSTQIRSSLQEAATAAQKNTFTVDPVDEKKLAQALAWNFVLGYLQMILPKIGQREEQRIGDKYSLPFLEKLLCLLPETQEFPESIEDIDPDHIIQVHPVKTTKTVAGNVNRDYSSSVYLVSPMEPQLPGVRGYLCMVEFCAPIRTLYKMFPSNREKLLNEIISFKEALTSILNLPFAEDWRNKIVVESYAENDDLAGKLWNIAYQDEMDNGGGRFIFISTDSDEPNSIEVSD